MIHIDSSVACPGFPNERACDGVLGESLHVAQVVVRTVLLQPFTNILLRPEHNGPDQAGLCGAGVIYSIIVTGAVLRPSHQPEVQVKMGKR